MSAHHFQLRFPELSLRFEYVLFVAQLFCSSKHWPWRSNRNWKLEALTQYSECHVGHFNYVVSKKRGVSMIHGACYFRTCEELQFVLIKENGCLCFWPAGKTFQLSILLCEVINDLRL